jgi:dTDP-4-dehydrorhamnose reductase
MWWMINGACQPLLKILPNAACLPQRKMLKGFLMHQVKDMLSILEMVQKVAEYWNLDQSLIKPISADSLNQAAKRPKANRLYSGQGKNILGYNPQIYLKKELLLWMLR